MKCPECGNEHTRVTNTVHEPDGETTRRYRQCKKCAAKFASYESYERADCEAPFENADLRQTVGKAIGWLQPPARHIPVVRDAMKLLEKAISSNLHA
jgi:transcriptional repressor NrdR